MAAFKNLLCKVPDISCVILNCSVGGEYSRACDIVERHLVPCVCVCIFFRRELLRSAVVRKIRKNHIRVFIAE